MNVRQRAKTFEALMSDSGSPENERKRSQDDSLTELRAGGISSNGEKQSGQGKSKPVPPPRKKRTIVPSRTDSPGVQQKTTSKTSPELQQTQQPEKTKAPSKKPPPPRPAPYRQLSSQSLKSHIPSAKRKELSASLSRRREINEGIESPKTSSGGSPKATPKPRAREYPVKPPRGSPKSSPVLSKKVPNGDPKKASSCEIENDSRSCTPGGSPEKGKKGHPRRPPPPKTGSSITKKPKPPVPPKPKRPKKPDLEREKKSATIPRAGSIESKEALSECQSGYGEDVLTKQRSLSSPLSKCKIDQHNGKNEEMQSYVAENGEKEHKEDFSDEEHLKIDDKVELCSISVPEQSDSFRDDNDKIISKISDELPKEDEVNNIESQNNINEQGNIAIVSAKDETLSNAGLNMEILERTGVDDTESKGELKAASSSSIDNENGAQLSELERSKSKEITAPLINGTIVHTDSEFHDSSVFGVVSIPKTELQDVEKVQSDTHTDAEALDTDVEGDNEDCDGRIHISEPMETDIDSEILYNNTQSHRDEHTESLGEENSPCKEKNLQLCEISSVNPTLTSGDSYEERKYPEDLKEEISDESNYAQDEAHKQSFETGDLTMKESFARDTPLTEGEIVAVDKLSTVENNHEEHLVETSIDVIECSPDDNGLLVAVNKSPVKTCASNAEESFCDDEQFTHEQQEFETEKRSETVADIADLNDALTSNVPSCSIPTLPNSLSDEKRSCYLETSLDDGFFNDDDVNDSGMTKEDLNLGQSPQPSEDVSNQPYETHIDFDVATVTSEDQSRDTVFDSFQDCPFDVLTATEKTESKENEVSSEVQEAEESPKLEGCSVKVAHYENVAIQQPNKSDLENNCEEPLSPQPIKPSRPSRLKNRHTYENTSLSPIGEPTGDTVEIAETVDSENSKKHFRRPDVYENASIMQAGDKMVEVDKSKPTIDMTSNRFDSYENAVVIRESTTMNVESHAEAAKPSEDFPDHESSTENKQADIRKSNYENVVFKEDTLEENEGVYQVPRRNSFHSESPTSSLVRSVRSASVGSMERKKGRINAAKRPFKTEAEADYAAPSKSSVISSEAEETYASPRSGITCSAEETYVIPKSIRAPSDADNVYVVPRSLNTPLTELDDTYLTHKSVSTVTSDDVYVTPKSVSTVTTDEVNVTPKSVSTVTTDDVYVTPKSIRSNSNETQLSEVEYQVPSSFSNEEMPNTDYEVPKSATDPGVEGCSTIDPATDDIDGPSSRRSARSSVVTSREQLRTSQKNVPQKPPRLSFDDSQVSPQPKPRSGIDHFSEKRGEKNEHEEPVASPTPKRPAPPRPKAPSFSMPVDKSPKKADEESKHKAPPQRPPPPLNRVSVVSSEQDSLPASPLDSSSDSEDERSPVHTGPPKKKTHHIAHEILSTEKTFVTALTLCYEDCYGMIKKADVVPESTLNHIFKDLGNIYHLDVKFLNELEERMRTWDENERIGDIVRKYSHFLRMYTTYINHYDKAISVLQETVKENLQFADLVQQFQASEKCKGLFLESFMLKPVQRIPSYRLLLIDYLKHLPPDSDEFKDIKVALDIVSEVATHINESMKQSDNFQRVLSIQESLVGNEEIVKPGREFIKEGTLQKLCRKDMQERTFFLLTDVLLYTSAVAGGQYKLKGTFPLLGIKVALPDSPEFENEFSIISKSRSFTLSASTQVERDEWIEELDKAVSALTKKKSTFLLSKDKAVVSPDEDEGESKLGDKAPVWIQDTRVTMCMLCTDKFTVTNRRHHCRGCGKVVCGSCSDNLAPLAYLDYSQARVCDICYEVLLKDQNKSIKETAAETELSPHSPVGISGDDLDRIHRKPPKFEILHRFKPGSRRNHRRSKIITARPSVRTEVVGHDSDSQMSGYLRFKRTNKHAWKRLWFVLKDNVLYTYKASEDVVAMETIPVLGYNVQEATRTEGDEIQFQLKHPGLPPISFKTETESSAFRWIQELRKATTL